MLVLIYKVSLSLGEKACLLAVVSFVDPNLNSALSVTCFMSHQMATKMM